MKKTVLFYLSDCPYCHFARRAVRELTEENQAYSSIEIEWVEESKRKDIADKFNYYYVPTIFHDGKKLYEAHPSQGYEDVKASIRKAFDTIIKCEG